MCFSCTLIGFSFFSLNCPRLLPGEYFSFDFVIKNLSEEEQWEIQKKEMDSWEKFKNELE